MFAVARRARARGGVHRRCRRCARERRHELHDRRRDRAPGRSSIGLEVHAQVISNAKLFSGAATEFGAEPNTQVSFVDAAFPGMLPVINRECVAQAVRTGLGPRGADQPGQPVRPQELFLRRPARRLSDQPVRASDRRRRRGRDRAARTAARKQIGVTRLHLEQDAGKSLHDQHPTKSYIDLNRSGVALMEIVSEPDMRSPEEAGAYLRKLRTILRYLGTCDGNMEEGSMRADVNVSVRKHGEPFRTRCEVKNVNSIRFVMQAIEAEAMRQVEVWEERRQVEQETRLFDPGRGETRIHAQQGGRPRLPLLPRPRLAAAGAGRGVGERAEGRAARSCRMPSAPASCANMACRPTTPRVLVAEKETAAFLRDGRARGATPSWPRTG